MDREGVLEHAFERYFYTAALFGTPVTCAAMVTQLQAIGVSEVASLIDFGVDLETTLRGLESLNLLRQRFQGDPLAVPAPHAGSRVGNGSIPVDDGGTPATAFHPAASATAAAGRPDALAWISVVPSEGLPDQGKQPADRQRGQ